MTDTSGRDQTEPGWDEEENRVSQADLGSVRRLLYDIIRENRRLGLEFTGAGLAAFIEHMHRCDICWKVYTKEACDGSTW